MRNQTLEALREDLKFELSNAAGTSLAKQVEPMYNHRLRRVQEWLWQDWDWPHMRADRDVKLQAGQRYYDVPDAIPFERIKRVRQRWGDVWIPVLFGIHAELFTAYDSDRDERSDPVQRWDYYGDAGETDDMARIEVWPIPVSNALEGIGQSGTLRFRGVRRLKPLVADTDRADLDGMTIVLYAAAQILRKRKQEDAQAVENAALTHYNKIKARYAGPSTADRVVIVGGDEYSEPHYTDYLGYPRIPDGYEHERF